VISNHQWSVAGGFTDGAIPDWTVANQVLTLRKVQKVVQFGAEMVPVI